MNTIDKVQAIIEMHEKDLGNNANEKDNFKNMIRDAIEEDILDEFLNVMFEADITISTEVVTQCLCERYISNWNLLNRRERENKVRSITHTINKNQAAMFKALI